MPERKLAELGSFGRKIVTFCWLTLFCHCLLANDPNGSKGYDEDTQALSSARLLAKQWNKSSVDQAIKLYLEVFRRSQADGSSEKAADCLREISSLYINSGRNVEAINLLNQAAILDRNYQDLSKTVKTHSLLAIASLRLGQIDSALKFSIKAIESSKLSNNNDSLATALYTLALAEYEHGRFQQATQHFESAFGLWKEDANLEGQVKALLELAYAYMTNDELLIGLEKAQESLRISNEISDLQHKTLAQNAVGVLKSKLGKKQEALQIFLRSEREFPDGLNSLEKGDMYNHLAGVYTDLNNLQLAQRYYEKALEIFQKVKNPFAELATLPKLGIITFTLGDEVKGLEYFKRGFLLADLVKSDYYHSVFDQDLGNLYLEKDKQKALEYFKKALPEFKKIKLRTHVAMVLNQLGKIYQSQQKIDLARDHFEESLKLNKETKNKFAEAESLFYLAANFEIVDNDEAALELSRQSLDLVENLDADIVNSALRRAYHSNIFDRYELYISLLMQKQKRISKGDFAIHALRTSERARGRAMLENLTSSEADFYSDAAPEVVQREEEARIQLNAKANKLTEALSADPESEETKKLEGEISELENRLEEIRAELKQKSPIYSAIKNPEPFDVADFQREVLGEDDLLLEFSLGKEESYLWAVDKQDVTAYYLPPRAAIEARVERLRNLLGARQLMQGESFEDYQKRMADADVEYRSEARALSNDLLGQAKDKLAGKRLIIVADGRLHYFPLGSLPMPGAEDDAPLLLTNEVVYEPSASALKIFRMQKNTESKPQKDLLVFADPVFSKSDERIAGLDTSNSGFVSTILSTFRSIESLESMPRLPASREEAKSISDVVGANQTTVRAGFAANRDGVLNGGIEDYKILHFATHGLIDERRPELSGILLSLYTDEGNENDGGFIRLQDVYGLRLNSDLVVLSACDTGIGKEIKGEGVMSLNNAFLQAGAKSVVSSLWKVDDTATKDLMTEFYRGMADDNLTAAAALRQAQIKMYNDPRYRSPFYWAAFTASGDDRVKVAFASNARLYGLIAAAIVFAALLAFVALRRRSRRPKFPAQ